MIQDYNRYKIKTENADWQGICEMNGISFDSFGTRKELEALSSYLEPDEVVFALASGLMKQTITSNTFDGGLNTWLVVLTSERFLFMDAALLTSSIDTQSVRLNKVQAISASQGFVFGKISIDLGSRLITIDNCTKESVKVMADLANKWLKELENGFTPPKENEDIANFKKSSKNNDKLVKPPLVETNKASRTSATLVTGFFGWFGLNDFIWGAWGAGATKCGLCAISFNLEKSGHYVLSAIAFSIICIWVFCDLANIYDGSYFKDKPSSAVSSGLTGFFSLLYLILLIGNIAGTWTEYSDESIKDSGKLASIREIVDTYNQNEAAADRTFDGKRLTIAGVIRSVEKDFWGDYVVKFEGLGPFNILNLGNKVSEIELTFPKKESNKLLDARKGDLIAANCIGRGLSAGTYSADKCKVTTIRKKSEKKEVLPVQAVQNTITPNRQANQNQLARNQLQATPSIQDEKTRPGILIRESKSGKIVIQENKK